SAHNRPGHGPASRAPRAYACGQPTCSGLNSGASQRPKEMTMAVCRIVETNATPEQYDSIFEKLSTGGASTASRTLHIAAVGEDGKIRVIELWESRGYSEAFGEAVRTARQ